MTFAQFVGGRSTGIIGALNIVVMPIIITLAFLVFIWGVIHYFFIHGDDETKRAEGRQFIMWGILAMALLFSVWGLVGLLLSTFGILPSA